MNSDPIKQYDYRNCQSLFGYAAAVHERSGGICQLCGAGSAKLEFDLWRQLTVEHLIGESQGGYLKQILGELARRFPDLSTGELSDLARRIDGANTITACSFCNSTTSRNRTPIAMSDAIHQAPDSSPDEIYEHVTADLKRILADKQQDVAWKLQAVRSAYESIVVPRLTNKHAVPPLDLWASSQASSDTPLAVQRTGTLPVKQLLQRPPSPA